MFVIKSEGLSDTTIHVFGSYTEPIPSIPELINPDHSSIHVSVNPVFKWTSVQYATGYDFNLISESDTIVSRSITDTTITDLTLEFSSSYQWQVRASNRQGNGEWSKSTFQTVGLPEIDLSNTNIIFLMNS